MKQALDRITNLGVAADLPFGRAVALRTTNGLIVVMALVSLASVATWYLEARSVPLAFVHVLFVLFYVILYLLNGSGLHDLSRFALILLMLAEWSIVSLAFGPGVGHEFYLIILLLIPSLIFARNERWKKAACLALLLAGTVATLTAAQQVPPIADMPPGVRERAYYVILVFMTCIITGLVIFYHRSSLDARLALSRERQKVEALLANVLPNRVSQRLQGGDRLIADSHGEATVLFADLVGFTDLTRRITPAHLVEVLNSIFSTFDALASKHHVEKIKTIGDCYMAVTGVMSPKEGQVEHMADFALEMLEAVARLAEEIGYPLQLRIGLSTGPVISGVIGTKTYSFDVWGETVNLASRMEAAGIAGKIRVTEAAYWRLRKQFRFEMESGLSVGGEDAVRSYFLVGRLAPGSAEKTGEVVPLPMPEAGSSTLS